MCCSLSYRTYKCISGEYRDGQKYGKGLLTYATGDRYEGTCLAGLPYGTGVYTYSGGGYYSGQYLTVAPGIGEPAWYIVKQMADLQACKWHVH